jgi:hypothetical protein
MAQNLVHLPSSCLTSPRKLGPQGVAMIDNTNGDLGYTLYAFTGRHTGGN